MKQCLNCNALSEDDAERCSDCHVPLHYYKSVVAGSAALVARQRQAGAWLSPVGSMLMVLGLLMVLYGLFSSGAPAYSETLNLGLLNDKTNTVIAGSSVFTSGSIFLGFGALIAHLSLLEAAKTAATTTRDTGFDPADIQESATS